MYKKRKWLLLLAVLCAGLFLFACGEKKDGVVITQTEESVEEERALEGDANPLEDSRKDGETAKADTRKNGEASEELSSGQADEQQEKIWVDVEGAVKAPGVYELDKSSRVFEAVEAAGGFTEEADTAWLNQAAVVTDGQKIQVYTREETKEMEEQGREPVLQSEVLEEEKEGKINLNLASLEELQEIPGIGEVRAQAIVDYREEAGAFGSIEEIQQVPGIKGKTFEKIEEYITVE